MLQGSPMYAYIPAEDVARARAFYEQKLGFEPKEEVAGGVVYAFTRGTACFLYPTPNAGTSKASRTRWLWLGEHFQPACGPASEYLRSRALKRPLRE